MAVTDTQITPDNPEGEDRQVSLADQIAAEFEKRQTASIGSGESGDEGLAAGTETETEPTDPHVNDDGEDGAGGGGEVTAATTTPPSNEGEQEQQQEQQQQVPNQLPANEPPMPPSFSMDDYAAQIYGRPLTQEETAQLFAWQQQFSQLDGEKLTAIDAIIRGQQTPQGGAPTTDDDDGSDPYIQQQIQQALAPIQQQLGQVSQFVETEAQRQARMERERVAADIEKGTSTFKEQYGLSDEDIADLEQRVVRSQTFPGLYQAFQGNGEQAMTTALEQVLWTTPTYRDRMIESQVQTAQDQAQADVTRKRKASALSGGGGSVSRDTPPPATQQGRQAAMAAELAEHMNGSGTQ